MRAVLAGVLGLAAMCGAHADPRSFGWLSHAGKVPPWAFGDSGCSATLIAPRVLLSTYYCIGQGPKAEMRQLSTGKLFGGEVVLHPTAGQSVLRPDNAPPVPGLILLAKSVSRPGKAGVGDPTWGRTVPIPSYGLEQRLLTDPPNPASSAASDATRGTRLGAYSGQVRTRHGRPLAYRHVSYRTTLSTPASSEMAADRPLVYRSIQRLRLQEPGRFAPGIEAAPGEDADRFAESHFDLRSQLRRAFGSDFATDRAMDDLAIAIAGLGEDRQAGLWNPYGNAYPIWTIRPFVAEDSGAGLLADRAGTDYLVGVVQGAVMHPRLSAHWPWIYRTLVERKMPKDAEHLARQVLPLHAFAADRSGRVGQLYGLRDSSTGVLGFFRLRQVEADGKYPAWPVPGTSDHWWQFLGTDLPTRQQVLAMSEEVRPATGASVIPLPGTDPVLPAPSATRR